jgi:hypothetical protein
LCFFLALFLFVFSPLRFGFWAHTTHLNLYRIYTHTSHSIYIYSVVCCCSDIITPPHNRSLNERCHLRIQIVSYSERRASKPSHNFNTTPIVKRNPHVPRKIQRI